jgi:hypothetical protein
MNKNKLAEISQYAEELYLKKLKTHREYKSHAFLHTVDETNKKFKTKLDVVELWKLIGGEVA